MAAGNHAPRQVTPWTVAALAHVFAVRLPSTSQMRALCRLAIGLRWVAITFASLYLLMAPRAPRPLQVEIVAGLAYNGLVLLAVMRAEDRFLPTIAAVTTVIDLLFCFTFIGFNNVVPASQQIAAYAPATIEAVAFFGILGAVFSVALFGAGVLFVEATSFAVWGGPFDGFGAFEAILIVILIAACLAGVNEVLVKTPPETVDRSTRVIELRSPTLRLSTRDQEILRLVGQGRSNAGIAAELGLSERMVKRCLERLLGQLKARNRAEAVAAASKLHLL